METFIIHFLIIIILNFVLFLVSVLILAYFGWFPRPEWMQNYIDKKTR